MKHLVQSETSARLKKLDRELRRAVRNPKDADAIHDLRVSIRRLRQELKVFGAWFKTDDVKVIRRFLRKLMGRCAAVRNCDVAIEVLEAAGCQSPKLVAVLETERTRARDELTAKVKDWRKKDRVSKWRGHLRIRHSVSHKSAEENARRLLPRMIEDLFRAGKDAARLGSSRQTMHRFRLKAKHLRYTLELFEQAYGEKVAKVMESLKGLQEKLGWINDCATTLEMIQQDPEAVAAVDKLASERESEFRAYWKQHMGSRERLRWKAALGAADRKRK